jgi:hypothetical protein
MKMKGTWVAWIAALALAAILVAPREGAAGPHPYIMPDPPGPQLGEPDVPGDSVQLGIDLLWRRVSEWLRVRTTSTRSTVTTKAIKRSTPLLARRTVR